MYLTLIMIFFIYVLLEVIIIERRYFVKLDISELVFLKKDISELIVYYIENGEILN